MEKMTIPDLNENMSDFEPMNHDKLSLAMAYVPVQRWNRIYPVETGFERGTIFPALDKPFIGEEAVPNGR